MRDYAELVELIRSFACNQYPQCEDCEMVLNGHECRSAIERQAADAIEKLLAALPHWISVEERLPKKDETVIVYYSWIGQSGTEYKEVSLATLEEMRYCGSKLLGWMPLPEPPKEVQDG